MRGNPKTRGSSAGWDSRAGIRNSQAVRTEVVLRRLAIVILVFVTLLMGALGWILGRPGVLRPEAEVFASPANQHAALSPGRDLRGSAEMQSRMTPAARGKARGE